MIEYRTWCERVEFVAGRLATLVFQNGGIITKISGVGECLASATEAIELETEFPVEGLEDGDIKLYSQIYIDSKEIGIQHITLNDRDCVAIDHKELWLEKLISDCITEEEKLYKQKYG